MNNYFKKEDKRKDQLFVAWNNHLDRVHGELSEISSREVVEFDEVYEDMVKVTHVAKNWMNLELSSGEKILNLPLSAEICKHTRRTDCMWMALGFYQGQWWPLEVTSIGTPVTSRGEFHLSMNPIMMAKPSATVMH